MIIFDLICEHQHRFEGWFQSGPEFAIQQERGLVVCPQCASPAVRKLPSAVAIGKLRGVEAPKEAPATPAAPAAVTKASNNPPVSGTQAMALYRQLKQAMISISEDVGTSFAEEARRMHYAEIPERLIRGQTSDDEYSALQEEGIEVLRLPNIKEEDLN